MNADQKKRAQIAIKKWWAADSSKSVLSTGYEISELLQELVDAPEVLTTTNPAQISSLAEPFGYFKAEPFGWTDCAETDDGAIALYTAPPAPSVPEAEPVARVTGYYAGYLSIATVDGRVLSAGTALYLAPPAPSVPDGWRLVPYTPTVLMLERAEYAVNNRPQPSKYEPSAMPAIIFWTAMLNYAPEAPQDAEPPADVELQAAFDRGLKAGNEQKDAQQVEIHRLHDLLAGAPTPAEAPADVARDAERYRWLRTHGLQRAWVSLGTDFEGDNFASFRCEFNLPEPPNLPYEDDEGLPWADKDFDAAIDAAIEREILGGAQS